jgi:hypothetical protein
MLSGGPSYFRADQGPLFHFADIFSFGPAVALFDFEGDLFALIQGFIPIHVDGREVNENIAAVLFVDKAIALFVIKPLYSTGSQNIILLFDLRYFSIF